MKMKKETYNALKSMVDVHHSTELHKAYVNDGVSDEQYRWDILFRSGFSMRTLYKMGLNDNHIDTALRKITGTR